MKRFQWRILICLIPLLGALGYLAFKFAAGREGFKLGVDLAGGTILVYELDEAKLPERDKREADKELVEKLAANIKRRIDPTDLKNITVRPVGTNRVEIILPLSVKKSEGETDPQKAKGVSLDDVGYIKSLIADVGSLEFRFLANEKDDNDALIKADEYFKDVATTKAKSDELARRAREGEPPPPPVPPQGSVLTTPEGLEVKGPEGKPIPVFDTPKGLLTYSWVEAGRGMRKDLNLDNEAENESSRNQLWNLAKEHREKGTAFRIPPQLGYNGALLYSRKFVKLNPAKDDLDKKYEYFILTRDPERDRTTGKPKAITGDYLTYAAEGPDDKGKPAVHFRFNSDGGDLFQEVTSKNAPDRDSAFKRHLAIVLDNQLISAPTLNQAIRNQGVISGKFTSAEVRRFAGLLRSGALPAALKPTPVSENTMGSTLGDETVRNGTLAVGISFVAVLAFMCLYYRFAGLVASVALLANLVLTVAAMVFVNATFTLPGLAGLVLMLGMAVDANVLIYERLREERDRGATLALALRNGYDRAFPTIVDTHLTSIFTALVLWGIGNDQLKGFGISLTIGLVISLFTSLYMTRVFFDVWLHLGLLTKLTMARWVPHTNINFMAWRNVWFTATVLLTLFGLGVFLFRGEKGLNIDFTGGVAYGAQLETPLTISELRTLLNDERKDRDGQRILTVDQIRPLPPDEAGRTLVYQISYRGDLELRRVKLINETTEEDLRRRLSELPDLSLEMITVGAAEAGGRSRFFTARTSEKDADVVRVVINRLMTSNPDDKNLKRVRLKDFDEIDKDYAGAKLVFDALASPGQVAVLLKDELENMGYVQLAKRFEIVPEGDVVDGRSTTLRLKLAEPLDPAKLKAALAATQRQFAEYPQPERLEKFDSNLAAETRLRALYAVLASWGAILMYLWFRFGNWTFGLAAVLCLVHDLVFTLGIIAFCHWLRDIPGLGHPLSVFGLFNINLGLHDFKIDFAAVAALLTLVGYSVNDTIVVFDRIREVRGKNPQLTYQTINDSVNQTLSRTLLTSFITWLVVLVLYIWGGEGVHLFAFVMVVGVIVGTYSSIYIASPLLILFGEGTQPSPIRGGETKTAPKPEGVVV